MKINSPAPRKDLIPAAIINESIGELEVKQKTLLSDRHLERRGG